MKLFDIFKQILKEDMHVDPQGNLVDTTKPIDISDANSEIKVLKNDQVYGNVYIPNSDLEEIESDVEVKGDLILTDCKNLKEIGKNVKIGGVFDIAGCDKINSRVLGMKAIGLEIGGDFIITGTPIGDLVIEHLQGEGLDNYYSDFVQKELRIIFKQGMNCTIKGKIILDNTEDFI